MQEQRQHLFHVSYAFNTLVKAAIDGLYSDLFFGVASITEGYRKRLRAVLRNTLTDFAEATREKVTGMSSSTKVWRTLLMRSLAQTTF